MGEPGFLTDAELAPVNGISLGGDNRMAVNAAARMNRAIAKLEAESGIKIVFSEWGLYRTAAIQWELIGSGGTDTSVRNSAHTQGVGADIYNQRTYRNWNEPRFVQILAEQGFIFDVSGEPWHVRGVNTAPAGDPGAPFDNSTQGALPMYSIVPADSVPASDSYPAGTYWVLVNLLTMKFTPILHRPGVDPAGVAAYDRHVLDTLLAYGRGEPLNDSKPEHRFTPASLAIAAEYAARVA